MPLRGTPSPGIRRCDYLPTGRRANEAHHHQTPSRRPRPGTDGGDRGAQSRARQASSEDLPELRARGPEPPGFLPGRPLLKTKMLRINRKPVILGASGDVSVCYYSVCVFVVVYLCLCLSKMLRSRPTFFGGVNACFGLNVHTIMCGRPV